MPAASATLPWLSRVASIIYERYPQGNAQSPPENPPQHSTLEPGRRDKKDAPSTQELVDSQKIDAIHQLLLNPALYDPLRTPRAPIVLCHGVYTRNVFPVGT
jgi:triacylglycerol lipase